MRSWERIIAAFKRFPGIGPKQAERMALHLLRAPAAESDEFLDAAREARSQIRSCGRCFNYTDREVCSICSDPARDHGLLCVVEDPQDVGAVERTRSFRGVYHVLHGRLSPLDGIGPERLRVAELVERVKKPGAAIREIVLATDADTEGEATALYLAQLLRGPSVKMTRIAQGVPLGGDLDYIDERTLGQAVTCRREL
ncbi:MAG: recombination protein RecR [Elusimicrobia bacterium]|nr:recombination protein RecR [Elusimicrobiota bacterium]MBI5882143.1 recombination protein RecR [Elusimicrobiota bacterium]